MSCAEIIASEIAATGPIPFSRFMEIALYGPECGFYARRSRIGRSGDFLTSVSAGAAFGRILAEQLREMWECLGEPSEFAVIEQGANDGTLATDLLGAVRSTRFEKALRLRIIEPLPALRALQEAHLEAWRDRVTWFSSVREMPSFTGAHFSNELVDALPFEILRSHGGAWSLQRVDGDARRGFVFCDGEEIRDAGFPARPEGFLTEWRPHAGEWMRAVAERLDRGFILVFDYGMTRSALLDHPRGTHVAFHGHRRDEEILADPGTKDLTAHVDFTDLAAAGRAAGLAGIGFTDQHHFLVGAATGILRGMDGKAPSREDGKFLRAFRTLMHPEALGTRFRAFCMAAGLAASPRLSGFASGAKGFQEALT